ncbi:hypothetical protein IG631_12294 [Alternaria alternata]|nr:hypothetical protein IG631_12294 [Alternaria alternata]
MSDPRSFIHEILVAAHHVDSSWLAEKQSHPSLSIFWRKLVAGKVVLHQGRFLLRLLIGNESSMLPKANEVRRTNQKRIRSDVICNASLHIAPTFEVEAGESSRAKRVGEY